MCRIMMLVIAGLGGVAASSEASASDRSAAAVPPAMQRLLQCRSLPDGAQRLACFDRETASVATDLGRKDLVIVDRGQLSRTRRSLFGFELPRIDLLGDTPADEVKQIETTLQAFGSNREGGALFSLADGTRWSQTDSTTLDVPPRRGDKVRVRKAALGSFVLSLQGQPAMKVKRVP